MQESSRWRRYGKKSWQQSEAGNARTRGGYVAQRAFEEEGKEPQNRLSPSDYLKRAAAGRQSPAAEIQQPEEK